MQVLGQSESWLRRRPDQTDWLWVAILSVTAAILFGIDLGGVTLRDWDEGTVAQVAREIWEGSPDLSAWLHPTLGDQPYFNKPPLMHWLIATTYSIGGVNEWTARLPGAILTTLSVPLLYGVGRELFHYRAPALFTTLVYLTTLPVVRHGRLAMLDGAVLCFMLLMMWCVLRSRRDTRYALGIGIGLGLICLTKGVMMGVLLGAIALAFLIWDTPRLLTSPYLWLGIGLGCSPVLLWYWAQWRHYGWKFIETHFLEQSAERVVTSVDNRSGPPWYYLLELVKYGFPWLLFLPLGIKQAWEHRNLSWAKLAIVWAGIYFVAISVMSTKLPWYVLPVYPALALICGHQLASMWEQGRHIGVKQPALTPYSDHWVTVFSLFILVMTAGAVYFAGFSSPLEPDLAVIFALLAVTLTVTAVLVAKQDPQFISVLIWGTYLALALLMMSNHWLWELNEAYPVKPVAQLIQSHTSPRQVVYTSYDYHRPSLDFYSDRRVIPATDEALKNQWERRVQPYALVSPEKLRSLQLEPHEVVGTNSGWVLITRPKA
ncbi:glycosyltransferase family 39 protein [Oscillatoria sp. FACHB-1407]|uniref:ArnT family glycosyltransferase n=1 Tax=Oscillatoria sp. FACHB-1407 TaxID=2692847 RepID=UPI0016827DE0|nr:glycosyltransferase family 39 protein [Oscillatoria sp. FACHB-1407]MBD2462566.1 glycosyltransferase family 39 protein [Oscillatoria sp. FACHB-1407]